MQNTKILSLTGLLMVFAALAANYGMARVAVPAVHRLPVETFPRQIGEWTAGAEIAADPEVQQKLPTATLVTRVYTNRAGESVELLLLTAGRREDFHSPNECFPGHGWELSDKRHESVDGQQVNTMMAERESVRSEVWYWWAGDLDFTQQANGGLSGIQNLRRTIYSSLGRADGMSLFVRMIAPRTPQGHQYLDAFTKAALPVIRQLGRAAQPSQQIALK